MVAAEAVAARARPHGMDSAAHPAIEAVDVAAPPPIPQLRSPLLLKSDDSNEVCFKLWLGSMCRLSF